MNAGAGFLGIDHVPFNVRLRDARLRLGWSRRRLALAVGMTPTVVGQYEALKAWPRPAVGERIATALQDSADYLFPPEVGIALKGRSAHVTTSVLPMEALTLDSPQVRYLPAPDLYEQVYDRDIHGRLHDAVGTLADRQQYVIRRHFGLDGESQTLAEIGQTLGVTVERVRQIEAKALRKLRNPSRSRKFMDSVSS